MSRFSFPLFELLLLPAAEEKAAKGGKEEPRLEARVHKVNGLEIILDVDRYRLVD